MINTITKVSMCFLSLEPDYHTGPDSTRAPEGALVLGGRLRARFPMGFPITSLSRTVQYPDWLTFH